MSSRKKTRRPSLKGSLNPSKRHRDRVNVELDNLAKLLPFAPEVIAKLDKLSVLRLSASYLRTKNFFKGLDFGAKLNDTESLSTLDEFEKTGLISDLLLEALDGFLMVLTQDAEVFYASETINDFLGVSQASVIHQDFMRFVHVEDQQLLENNLKLVVTPPEQKIREIIDDEDALPSDHLNTDHSNIGEKLSKERSFVCRLKCILNTNAGFFKPFKCHGRLRAVKTNDPSTPRMALFLICSPLEISTSIIEVRMKSMLFCTKNKLDLTFVDIDQKGKQIVGYVKKDILAQSSYCMMHYDDIPILKGMHHDLMTTGSCEGVFRWLNKNNKWQWLSGSGRVILKNNRPDFVITTNKPLSDEEGEEEVRRREREMGIIPTSPSSMLSILQLGSPPGNPPVNVPEDFRPQNPPQFPSNPSVPSSIVTPGLSTTSCTSDPFPPEDLPSDLSPEILFETNGDEYDSQASLSDLDSIVTGDLMHNLFDLETKDLKMNCFDDSNTVPLTHAPNTTYASSQIVPPTTELDPWMHRSQGPFFRQPPSNMGMSSSNIGATNDSSTRFLDETNLGNLQTVSAQSGQPSLGVRSQNLPPNMFSAPSLVPTQSISQNVSHVNGQFQNPSARVVSQHGSLDSSRVGLLKVRSQQAADGYIKPERSTGYCCNPNNQMSSSMSWGMTNNLSFQSQNMPLRQNDYRYQNKLNYTNQRPSQWAMAPPSPYSSGSSSTSSYDALHVQFSPTESLASPFASPHGDKDHIQGNLPLHAQGPQYLLRGPPAIQEPFLDMSNISSQGMVEELIPGINQTSPVGTRQTTTLSHM